jgi:hypothetical protein
MQSICTVSNSTIFLIALLKKTKNENRVTVVGVLPLADVDVLQCCSIPLDRRHTPHSFPSFEQHIIIHCVVVPGTVLLYSTGLSIVLIRKDCFDVFKW